MVLNARDAIKQVKKAGNINIKLLKNSQWIRVNITDEGVGMSKETMAKAFDPFFSTKDVGKGTGLGLSICQSIIEKHKGAITIQSEPNKGSTFTIHFSAPGAKLKKETAG